ncbi:hypothetical protein EVAR_95151_1 [Eumeta japonica]|uniref:Uncharacterized protein n=1 Tax=Eumeta variegata TaxID=151549 RepID=A0A4C1W5V2_EUMVA|nr:hypothetical protein EVAR_95151_1 [Eumeta japonica]
MEFQYQPFGSIIRGRKPVMTTCILRQFNKPKYIQGMLPCSVLFKQAIPPVCVERYLRDVYRSGGIRAVAVLDEAPSLIEGPRRVPRAMKNECSRLLNFKS